MPELRSFSTLHHYDPALDGEAIVLAGYTGEGTYWIRALKAPEGRRRRAQREEMLARITAAIKSGQPPGEVDATGPLPENIDATFDPEDY